MEKETLSEIKLLIFNRKFLEKKGKSSSRKFFEEIFNQFFVKTVERSTDEEETKMKTTVSPIQENFFKNSELFTTFFYKRKVPKYSD